MKAEVEDLDDSRVLDLRGRLRFVEEPVDGFAILGQLGREHLDDGPVAEHRVLGDVHDPHAAFPETADYLVAADGLPDHLLAQEPSYQLPLLERREGTECRTTANRVTSGGYGCSLGA